MTTDQKKAVNPYPYPCDHCRNPTLHTVCCCHFSRYQTPSRIEADRILYKGDAVEAVQQLLERGKATINSDGYLVLIEADLLAEAQEALRKIAAYEDERPVGAELDHVSALQMVEIAREALAKAEERKTNETK